MSDRANLLHTLTALVSDHGAAEVLKALRQGAEAANERELRGVRRAMWGAVAEHLEIAHQLSEELRSGLSEGLDELATAEEIGGAPATACGCGRLHKLASLPSKCACGLEVVQ